jgi:hypothetical protein
VITMPHASSHRRKDGSALPFEFRAAAPPAALRAARRRRRPGGRAAASLLGPAAMSLALALALLATPAVAASPTAATGALPEMSLRSCVRGSPPLTLAVTVEKAQLDGGDRQRFQAAAQARYPLYQRGGLQATQVLLLRRAGQWQYVTLGQDGRSGALCVTAVFAADRFAFTPAWLAKYQPRAGEPDD